MCEVKILSGVSGSGKSTLAKNIRAVTHQAATHPAFSVTVSADDFFMKDGKYLFDPSKLGEAHASCFRSFIEAMREIHTYQRRDGGMMDRRNDLIIVDNTNTTVEEIAPYVLGASAFGYECEIITIMLATDDDLQKCVVRNTHKIPASVIISQQSRLLKRKLPPWWNARISSNGFGL